MLTILRHKEWRKIAKRERRRKYRIKEAQSRDSYPPLLTEEYKKWVEDQEAFEQFELNQLEKANAEENEKWIIAEKNAIDNWQKMQKQKEKLLQEQLEKEEKIKMEWQLEQKRKEEEEKKFKEIEEERERIQKQFMEKLERFLSGDDRTPPAEMMVSSETKPNMEPCPFFSKTACCRFGDQCSRNHKYPGISKVLLATNFYTHFGLSFATNNEYDTDVMLEYEDSDTYKEFKEFFYDVLPEFEKFGKVIQFKVCNNFEKHLRGNTYVEYAELRDAVAAYRNLHTRWYGGKQLSLQFCCISSWKNAICGLQSVKRCPKGRSCNFLHVFRNPNNKFSNITQHFTENKYQRSPSRSWRWSESPARVPSRKRRRSRSHSRSRSRSPRVRARSRSRSRSRSRERKYRHRENRKKKKER